MNVLSTAQALHLHGRGTVRHAVKSGKWQRPVRGVVITHNGPLTQHERRLVYLAASPRGSAFGGATALEFHGLTGFESDLTYLILPAGARMPTHPDVVVHRSTQLDEPDVHPLREPRSTRAARSVIDFASWASSERYARAAVLAALQQGLVSPKHMYRALERRGDVLRVGLVRESVFDSIGGKQSLPEADFAQLILSAGLPKPTRQRAVQGPDQRYKLDAYWEEFGLAVEVHGLPHHGVVQWSNDLVRANEITIDGSRLLIFTSYVIRHEPGQVVDQLTRALRAAGWRGTPVWSGRVRDRR